MHCSLHSAGAETQQSQTPTASALRGLTLTDCGCGRGNGMRAGRLRHSDTRQDKEGKDVASVGRAPNQKDIGQRRLRAHGGESLRSKGANFERMWSGRTMAASDVEIIFGNDICHSHTGDFICGRRLPQLGDPSKFCYFRMIMGEGA